MAKPQLPRDFKEFLKLCLDHEVRFLVIGGLAVVHHGHPRLTLDMDIWIERSVENGERIIRVLKAFGFNQPEVSAEDFAKESQILRMGFKPTAIELFNRIPGVEFAACYERRVFVKIGRMQVPFIGLEDLKTNKQASGRLKDLQDIEELP
jgi:predicted nucleotidyltransferase